MNDIIIKVDTETGRAVSNTELLGIKGQNLQNKLIFKMSEKIKGIAWCEVRQDNTLSYIALKENNTGYEANILSSLLTTSSVDVNLRITETENSSGVPVFVSSIVSFVVLDSINASEQMPEEYPSWLDIANAKIQEIENVNIKSERIDTGVLIKTTDNQGQTTTVELKDGKQNILTAGDNIKLENDIISSEVPVYIVQYNKLDEAGLILKKVFELYKAGTEFQLILKDGNSIYQLTKIYDSSSAGTVSFYFADPELSGALTKYGINYQTVEYFSLFLYLNDNSVRRSRPSSYTFQKGNSAIWPLGAKNTEEYTPTSDYNPSTKKYVDDSIKSAITDTLGGSY